MTRDQMLGARHRLAGLRASHAQPRPGEDPTTSDHTLWFSAGTFAPGPVDGDVLTVDGLALPALSNGHDHGKVVGGPNYGARDDVLELWLPEIMTAPRLPSDLVATAFFTRAARSGVASSMALHNLRPPAQLADELRAVAKAAETVGVRTAIGVPLHDRQFLAYASSAEERAILHHCGLSVDDVAIIATEIPSTQQAMELVDQLAQELQSDLVTVQYGPLGPQWASDELLGAIAEGSARTGRRIHMHLFETIRQREWADARFRGGLIRHLDTLGLLSPRLSVAHGVWLRRDELELFAERGVTVSVNASSNLRLRSGFPPLAAMLRAGTPVAIGLDGGGFDDDADIWRELRVAQRLGAGHALDTAVPTGTLFERAVNGGAFAVHGGLGPWGFATGALADVVVLDPASYAPWALDAYRTDPDLVVGRARQSDVTHLVVGGRLVVADGRALGVDEPALIQEISDRMAAEGDSVVSRREVFTTLRPALRQFYASDGHRHRSEPTGGTS